jgi:hypothetical protein
MRGRVSRGIASLAPGLLLDSAGRRAEALTLKDGASSGYSPAQKPEQSEAEWRSYTSLRDAVREKRAEFGDLSPDGQGCIAR